jgi:hypothetical protein
MGYLVELKHYRPTYRKGDLEDELVIEHARIFKTRKEAKNYIERNFPKDSKGGYKDYHRGNKPSRCAYFTGKTWIHENTGEKCEEYYMFVLTKV